MSLLLLFRTLAAAVTPTDGRPLIGMRYSDDNGHTWSKWRWRPLGKAGQYKKIARWNGLGTVRPPGRIFQLKCTDPTVRRYSRLLMNVPPS